MSDPTKSQRKAFRAALRGMLWLTSGEAREKGFRLSRASRAIKVDSVLSCPLGSSGPPGSDHLGRWSFVTTLAGHSAYDDGGEAWLSRRGFDGVDDVPDEDLNAAWDALLRVYAELADE